MIAAAIIVPLLVLTCSVVAGIFVYRKRRLAANKVVMQNSTETPTDRPVMKNAQQTTLQPHLQTEAT